MKKRINTGYITNELEGASAFFTRPAHRPSPAAASPQVPPGQRQQATPSTPTQEVPPQAPSAELHQAREAAENDSAQTRQQATELARYHDSLTEAIRKTVKEVGKEVTFVRLTVDEKRQLADIAYTYKRQGVKTSENELSRIAINYVLEDYKMNRHASILAKVIAALLA